MVRLGMARPSQGEWVISMEPPPVNIGPCPISDYNENHVDYPLLRVSQGGHHIPTPVIQRRFKSGLALFHSHYKHIVNAWMLYDNSNDTMKLIDSGENQ